jgi:hypothetical protein
MNGRVLALTKYFFKVAIDPQNCRYHSKNHKKCEELCLSESLNIIKEFFLLESG